MSKLNSILARVDNHRGLVKVESVDIAGVGVVVDGDDETVDTVDGVDVGDVDVVEVDADYVGTSTTTYGRTHTSNATIENKFIIG